MDEASKKDRINASKQERSPKPALLVYFFLSPVAAPSLSCQGSPSSTVSGGLLHLFFLSWTASPFSQLWLTDLGWWFQNPFPPAWTLIWAPDLCMPLVCSTFQPAFQSQYFQNWTHCTPLLIPLKPTLPFMFPPSVIVPTIYQKPECQPGPLASRSATLGR